jgi:hypothetical protein
MDDPGGFRLLVALFALILMVALAVTQLRPWWQGTTHGSPDTPPPGWLWGAASWRGSPLPMSLLVGLLTTCAILLSVVERQASWVTLWAAVAAAAVWLSVVVLGRPRQLIPPAWRPERTRSRGSQH